MTRRPRKEEGKDLTDTDMPTGLELEASNQPYVQLSFQLPAFYMRVLDGEAKLLSQRRATLLELLVLRKSGVIKLERSPSAPRYHMDRRDLHVLKRYVWHCRPEIKQRLDELRERMGNIPPRSWVVLALNEWIGMPAGMGDLDDEGPTQIRPPRIQPPPPPPPRRVRPTPK